MEDADTAQSKESLNSGNDDVQDDLKKSTSHLLGLLGPAHPGRPNNEEPHVKKTMKNKKEKTELICRVDQDQLGFQEDDYDDLKALFMLFDYDQDGVVSMKEGMGMLRCLGLPTDEANMSDMVRAVGVDKTCYSLSFNEYLSLVSLKRREEPRDSSLLASFSLFDYDKSGTICVQKFRQILKTKLVSDGDINEMIEEYRKYDKEHQTEETIDYKEFVKMLNL